MEQKTNIRNYSAAAKPLKAKTRQEVASEYGIDRKTFYRWLKKNDLKVSTGLLLPSDLEQIYGVFGTPRS